MGDSFFCGAAGSSDFVSAGGVAGWSAAAVVGSCAFASAAFLARICSSGDSFLVAEPV